MFKLRWFFYRRKTSTQIKISLTLFFYEILQLDIYGLQWYKRYNSIYRIPLLFLTLKFMFVFSPSDRHLNITKLLTSHIDSLHSLYWSFFAANVCMFAVLLMLVYKLFCFKKSCAWIGFTSYEHFFEAFVAMFEQWSLIRVIWNLFKSITGPIWIFAIPGFYILIEFSFILWIIF